jgi:hypothetical protein
LQDYGEDEAQYLLENNRARKKTSPREKQNSFHVENKVVFVPKKVGPPAPSRAENEPYFSGQVRQMSHQHTIHCKPTNCTVNLKPKKEQSFFIIIILNLFFYFLNFYLLLW